MAQSLYPLEIRLLGPIEVRVEGQRLPKLRSAKGTWLLALLVLRMGREVDRRWLAETLWPDSSEENALATLRRTLTDLKAALGDQGHRLRTPAQSTIMIDLDGALVDIFALDNDDLSLEDRIACYGGRLCEGCSEDWVQNDRIRYEEQYIELLERAAGQREAAGDYVGAINLLTRLRAADPLRESATAALMRCFVAKGDHGAAVGAYRDLREVLLGELNREPSDDMKSFVRELRDKARAVVHARPKPLETIVRPPSEPRKFSFPKPITPLVGRQAELDTLIELGQSKRLITLMGMGGMGKTRLALAYCVWAEEHHTSEIAFIDLSSIGPTQDIGHALLEQLGLSMGDLNAPDRLAERLSQQETILVLDNCEQLIGALAPIVADLLSRCSQLVIIATTRQPLGIYGEEILRVGPLALPDQGSTEPMEKFGAIELFMERARAAAPGFTIRLGQEAILAKICARLDGCPLAIELAASRLRAMSLDQLDNKLSDRFALLRGTNQAVQPRQQTLRAVIDWSFDLLDELEQTLFRRLGIFSGAFDLTAAEEVCGFAPLNVEDCWDTLAGLVDRSLVWTRDTPNGLEYRLLESSRDYARAKLVESEDPPEVRHRLAKYLAESGDEARRGFFDHRMEASLAYFVKYADDYRMLLEQYIEVTPEVEVAAPLVVNCHYYWNARGYYREAVKWMRILMPLIPKNSLLYAELLNRYAFCLALADLPEDARAKSKEAMEVARELGNKDVYLSASNNYGKVLEALGEYEEALPLYESNLRYALEAGMRSAEHIAYHNIGVCRHCLGDFAQAKAFTDKCIAYCREVGNTHWLGWALGNAASALFRLDDVELGIKLLDESTRLMRDVGNFHGLVQNLISYAQYEVYSEQHGDAARAATFLSASLRCRKDLGLAESAADRNDYRAVYEKILPILSADVMKAATEAGAALDLDAAVRKALREFEDPVPNLRLVTGSA